MKTHGVKSSVTIMLVGLLTISVQKLSFASEPEFVERHLSRSLGLEEGLPALFVDDICRDSDGFIWAATSGGGLCRYDGHEFLTFTTGSAISIKNNFVKSLAEDGFHRLWIATEGGLDILDLTTYEMCDLSRTPLNDCQRELCTYLTVDAKGCVWAKCGQTIVRAVMDGNGKIVRYDRLPEGTVTAQTLVCRDVDADGTVWTCIGGGIFKVAPAREGALTATRIAEEISLSEDAYLSDFLVKEGEVWISSSEGLIRYDPNTGRWKDYHYIADDPRSLSQNFITGLAVTEDKQLIAVSLRGINVYDPLEDDFERIGLDTAPGAYKLMKSDFMNCIKVYGSQIWLGTESAGITQLYPKELSVQNISHDSSDNSSIGPNPVNSILEGPDGTLWTGNVESGLSYRIGRDNRFGHLTTDNSGLSHNTVSTLCADSGGRIWIGTWGGGVNILEDAGGRWKIRKLPEADYVFVGSLEMDPFNNLMWIGTNSGIFYCDLETGRFLPALEEQTTGCVGSCIDDLGFLWMGSQEGVYVFDLNTRHRNDSGCEFSSANYRYKLDNPQSGTVEKIYSVCKTSDGTVWLGSYGNGIYRVTREEGRITFTNYDSEDGLVNNGVKCILEDGSGCLWISTDNGLSQFDPVAGHFTTYTAIDGLASARFYINAAARGSDGLLYFGHNDGLSVIDPQHTTRKHYDMNPHFTKISISGRDSYNTALPAIVLHEKDKSVTFEFSALDFLPGSGTGYSYMMEGQDDDWVELPQGRRFVSYPSMRHGRYNLKIRCRDRSGLTSGYCEIPVRVRPFFYHSWWFYTIAAISVIFLALAVQEVRMKRLVRQREELQAIVEERTREIKQQQILLEEKAEELTRQNRILTRQNEELAGHKILFAQESRPAETPRDEKFTAKVLATVRELYRNPDLDVTTFCSAIGMSKTMLNRHLQETFGQSIGQFIRTYRLSIAREMLTNNRESRNRNISEIAYESGFNDPKYFTRCFTKEFGVSPSSYQES